MPRAALLALLIATACSSDPSPPAAPDASAPCGGACGAGTVCESGRCVAVDAGGDAAPEDAPTPPPDAAPGLDVSPEAGADAPTPDAAADVGAELRADAPVDVAPRCDADLQTDNENCGTCRNWCGGGRYCYQGRCVRTCVTPAGTPTGADCDGNDANGCETPLGTSMNCGACGVVCRAPLECFPVGAGFMCR